MTNKVITAACCIIGDEILSGKTKDTNSHYLATTLFDLGIELKTIQVVADDREAIKKSVKELSSQYDLVFTSGGIGKSIYICPTHDDITYESIASAFGLEMKVDQMTYQYIEKQIKKGGGKEMTKHHARLATFPSPAILLRERKEIMIPIVVVNRNVYILPGIPRLFKLLMDSLQMKLQGLSGTRFYRREIATSQSEVVIADVLSVAQTKADLFGIKIGSYPIWGAVDDDDDVRVIVNVSGKDELKVNEMSDMITSQIQGWPYYSEEKRSRL
ncbi:MoaB/Mog domain-containing protein [Pilaira anomala]|nr:MoaB/Mog domain-containing protein [Pilaira anomala]